MKWSRETQRKSDGNKVLALVNGEYTKSEQRTTRGTNVLQLGVSQLSFHDIFERKFGHGNILAGDSTREELQLFSIPRSNVTSSGVNAHPLS